MPVEYGEVDNHLKISETDQEFFNEFESLITANNLQSKIGISVRLPSFDIAFTENKSFVEYTETDRTQESRLEDSVNIPNNFVQTTWIFSESEHRLVMYCPTKCTKLGNGGHSGPNHTKK